MDLPELSGSFTPFLPVRKPFHQHHHQENGGIRHKIDQKVAETAKECDTSHRIPPRCSECTSDYSTIKIKANVSFLAAILQTPDPLLRELHVFLSDSKAQSHFGFTLIFSHVMDSAAHQDSSIKATKKKCLTGISNDIRKHWVAHLSTLDVQGMFSNIASLEKERGTWRKIIHIGLPSGQFSLGGLHLKPTKL